MSTDVAKINPNLPAHLRRFTEQVKATADDAKGGINNNSFARISISGSKFHLVKDGKTTLLTDPRDAQKPFDKRDPLTRFPVIIIKSNPGLSKIFYEKGYTPGAADEPDCASDDGITPNVGVPNKQADKCAGCKHNVWGARITPSGKKAKACADNKRLAILPETHQNIDPLGFLVTPSSLKDWAKYVEALTAGQRPVFGVVTDLTFDASADFPKVKFSYSRDLEEAEVANAEEKAASQEAALVVNPKAAFVAPTDEPTQATEQVVSSEKNHQPAQESADFGGIGQTTTAEAADAVALGDPATPTGPLNVLDEYAPHVKAAVEAAGGLKSPGGKAVFEALRNTAASDKQPPVIPAETGVDDPFGGKTEAKVPKKTKAKAKEATKEGANLSQAPAKQVVTGGDLDSLLEDALGKAS